MPYFSIGAIWMSGLLAATMITLLRHFVRRVFSREGKIPPTHNPPPKPKKKLSIRDLPPELMDMIQSSLSPLSQVCLALSCRKLYSQFESIVKSSVFRFPYSNSLDIPVDLELRTRLLASRIKNIRALLNAGSIVRLA
jgi:hypothetical protein